MKVSYLFDWYGEILSEKQQLAVELYYNDDLSLSEVADTLGISRQGVRDCLKRSENALFEMESKLGLAKKFESARQNIDSIRLCAEKICSVCSDPEVLSSASSILECTAKLYKDF